MNAAERIVQLLDMHRAGENKWRGRCPAHQGHSDNSLAAEYVDGKVILHCFGGCSLKNILDALGMKSAAELFDSSRMPIDPHQERQARARRNLLSWRNRYLKVVCKVRRLVNSEIDYAAATIQSMGKAAAGVNPEAEGALWSLLGRAVALRQQCDEDFEVLNSDDMEGIFEMWQKAQGK
jgi:hypothetical protein